MKIRVSKRKQNIKSTWWGRKKAALFMFFHLPLSYLNFLSRMLLKTESHACSGHQKNVDFTECHLESQYLHLFALLYSGSMCFLIITLSPDTKFPGKKDLSISYLSVFTSYFASRLYTWVVISWLRWVIGDTAVPQLPAQRRQLVHEAL